MSEYFCQICEKKYTEDQAINLRYQCNEKECNGELSVIFDIKETINVSTDKLRKKEKENEERKKRIKKEIEKKEIEKKEIGREKTVIIPPTMKEIMEMEKERKRKNNRKEAQKDRLLAQKKSDSTHLTDFKKIFKYVLSIGFVLFVIFSIYNYFTEKHRKQKEIELNIEKINKWGYVNVKENPKVRKGVNMDSEILVNLTQGEKIYVYDLDKKMSQYRIKIKNVEGYIHQDNINFEFVPTKDNYIPNKEFMYGTWNIVDENSKYVFNKDNSGIYIDKKNRRLSFSWSLYGNYNKSLIIDVNENNNRWVWKINSFNINKLELHCDDYNLNRTIKR